MVPGNAALANRPSVDNRNVRLSPDFFQVLVSCTIKTCPLLLNFPLQVTVLLI
jgi:hypothetical protein